MGNIIGTTEEPSQEVQDLTSLADQFPFGDAELRHLYRAYHVVLEQKRRQRQLAQNDPPLPNSAQPTTAGEKSKYLAPSRSFLVDWAVQCIGKNNVGAANHRAAAAFAAAEAEAEAAFREAAREAAEKGEPSLLPTVNEAENEADAADAADQSATAAQQHSQLKPPQPLSLSQLRHQRRAQVKTAEDDILPANFGWALERAAFLCPGDTSAYDRDGDGMDSSGGDGITDEYTRKARLEKFFEGLSNAGRRGSKKTVQVMFDTIVRMNTKEASKNESDNSITSAMISAVDFVEMGYRIALAICFLQQDVDTYSDEEDDQASKIGANRRRQDAATSFCCKHDTRDNAQAIHAMARSLEQCRRNRMERERYSYTPTAATTMTSAPAETNAGRNNEAKQFLVELVDVQDWVDTTAPLFASLLPTLLFQLFFPGKPYPPSRTPFVFPTLTSDDVLENEDEDNSAFAYSSFFLSPSSALLFNFACLNSSLTGTYYRLYTSANDGLSFNRLQNSLLGYAGPTLLLITPYAVEDPSSPSSSPEPLVVLGAFTASAWKESKDFYGSTDAFLYRMLPSAQLFRPKFHENNFQYCNSAARSKGYDQQAHGIGFGGSVQQPRLFLPESFEDCSALTQDLTYENGCLLPKTASGAVVKRFDIENLEVWGVGGDELVQQALAARIQARELRKKMIDKARKVDKSQFLDDFRSGAVSSKAFAFQQQIDGRADADVQERRNQQNNS